VFPPDPPLAPVPFPRRRRGGTPPRGGPDCGLLLYTTVPAPPLGASAVLPSAATPTVAGAAAAHVCLPLRPSSLIEQGIGRTGPIFKWPPPTPRFEASAAARRASNTTGRDIRIFEFLEYALGAAISPSLFCHVVAHRGTQFRARFAQHFSSSRVKSSFPLLGPRCWLGNRSESEYMLLILNSLRSP